jgi:hypothetical protein
MSLLRQKQKLPLEIAGLMAAAIRGSNGIAMGYKSGKDS